MSGAGNDVQNIRQTLEALRKVLSERLAQLERDLRREKESLVTDSSDQAIQRENDETLEAIEDATIGEIAAIGVALQRLARGQYGLCSACGGSIESARLAAVPQAVTCARCARAESAS